MSTASKMNRRAYVAGCFDTKAADLTYLCDRLERRGLQVVSVDVSTSRQPDSPATVTPTDVARHHPGDVEAVFTGQRGSAVAAMSVALERFIATRSDVGGLISAAGSGGTALVTPAMQALAVGVPKVMVSTVAAGNVTPYVGSSDICMMYSVTDVQGLNRISRRVLGNAAEALAGMILHGPLDDTDSKPAVGLTMFGLTTPCVQAVTQALAQQYDCLVFHATGVGGRSMERLADSGLLAGIIDVTTTEVADMMIGGIFAATEDRFGAVIRSALPYVGSCGALDMVNFGAMATVPAAFKHRNLYVHNPQVTLMRTTPHENAEMGAWIARRLNQMQGPTSFLLPLRGVSLLDAPGAAFHDPEADRALFEAIERTFEPTPQRRLLKLDCAINDPQFAAALVEEFLRVVQA